MMRKSMLIVIAMMTIAGAVQADLGGTVFKEDFSKYEVGDPITDWGTSDVVVIKTGDDRTWVQAQTPGQHKIEKRLRLPENFVMTFSMMHEEKNIDILFIDSTEEIHTLSFYKFWDPRSRFHIKFQDTVEKSMDGLSKKTAHNVKIVKKNKTFKLFVNDNFIVSSTPQSFGRISGIALKIEPSTKIGNFEIKELILE